MVTALGALLFLGAGALVLSQVSSLSKSGGISNAIFGKSSTQLKIEQQEKQDKKTEQERRNDNGVFGNTYEFLFGRDDQYGSNKPQGRNISRKGNA